MYTIIMAIYGSIEHPFSVQIKIALYSQSFAHGSATLWNNLLPDDIQPAIPLSRNTFLLYIDMITVTPFTQQMVSLTVIRVLLNVPAL